MTDTEVKLRDAATQMKLAIKHSTDEDILRSCVNSYISHARSVTMVMEKESSKDQELLAWYKSKTSDIGNNGLFKFFNSQRVHSIHRGVVKPEKQERKATKLSMNQAAPDSFKKASATIEGTLETLPFHENDVLKVTKDGKVWGWYFTEHKKDLPEHSGNVFALCELYFGALKALVQEWVKLKANKPIKRN